MEWRTSADTFASKASTAMPAKPGVAPIDTAVTCRTTMLPDFAPGCDSARRAPAVPASTSESSTMIFVPRARIARPVAETRQRVIRSGAKASTAIGPFMRLESSMKAGAGSGLTVRPASST